MHARSVRLPLVLWLILFASVAKGAEDSGVKRLVARLRISKGICSVPHCGSGGLAMRLATESGFLVHAFDTDRETVAQAVQRAEQAGFHGDRIAFECITTDVLPYADNFVDLLVLDALRDVQPSEVLRVVRPLGYVAFRDDAESAEILRHAGFNLESPDNGWTVGQKPAMAGVDDWPHWSHGPDNNPVSTDTAIRAPYITQWFAKPYYHAMPVVTTAAAGRVFIATGHIAHHDREIPTLNTLMARNGYNGQVLWKRDLPDGFLVHRSAFIATEDIFYMLDGDGVLQLDTETGEELGRLEIPEAQASLMWMAKIGNMLYLLAGEEPPAEIMEVHATFRGWGWNNVDKNYSPDGKHQIRWGFGSRLLAFDLDKEEVAWTHDQSNIDSRGMGILEEKLFYYVPGKKLTCMDRRDGRIVWSNEDRDALSLIEEEAQGLTGTPGFRTAAMLLATPVGLFIQGQKRMNVAAFSLEDGDFLWTKKKHHNNPNMLFADGVLYISGIERSGSVQTIDPQTGDTIEDLHFWKGSCTRMTGSPEALFCRGEGLGRYDLASGVYTSERTARPGCNDGAIPANGLLYVGPWLCDCNLSILGQMVLGPAHEFDAQEQIVSDANLESVAPWPTDSSLEIDELDWPTYRANNRRTGSSSAAIASSASLLWHGPASPSAASRTQAVTVAGLVFTTGEDGFIRCLDAGRGTPIWRFATGGPIQASPTVAQGRVLAGSGDGYVYCLDAISGKLLWRFRVAPVERRISVYGRLASNWPVNSGVLVDKGIAYAAAGIVFRDGTHVVALDVETGRLKWHNGTTGVPLNERGELRAASALGTLAVGAGRLWLASGNVVTPTSFDLATGEAEMTAAERIPVWNSVVAQKPEPAGRDIMVFADQFLLHGGRLLYSDPGPVVTASQFNFRMINESGRLTGPAFTPARHCAVPPTWDDEIFVTPTARYGNVVAWSVGDVVKRLGEAGKTMIEMDREIPGDRPEKSGEYNLIGQVFRTVERHLQSTSLWPATPEEVYSIAVAKNAVVMTGRIRGDSTLYFVTARSKTDGTVLWGVDLPTEPTLGGLAIDRNGRSLITLQDGSILCVGK